MNRVWKLAVPVTALLVVLGYAAASLGSSDLDDVNPRETIVIDEGAEQERPPDDDRPDRPGKEGGSDRGDDGRKGESDDDRGVIQPDVEDVDDDDDDGGATDDG